MAQFMVTGVVIMKAIGVVFLTSSLCTVAAVFIAVVLRLSSTSCKTRLPEKVIGEKGNCQKICNLLPEKGGPIIAIPVCLVDSLTSPTSS